MEGDQLKLLEERIGKAIDFIEKLKSREKVHIQEKEELRERLTSLEEEIKDKNESIDELKESQVFLKEKIETILGKLESWADMVDVGGYDLDTAPEPEGPAPSAEMEEPEEAIEGQEPSEASEVESGEEQEESEEDPGADLFDTGEEEAEETEESEDLAGSDEDASDLKLGGGEGTPGEDLKDRWFS